MIKILCFALYFLHFPMSKTKKVFDLSINNGYHIKIQPRSCYRDRGRQIEFEKKLGISIYIYIYIYKYLQKYTLYQKIEYIINTSKLFARWDVNKFWDLSVIFLTNDDRKNIQTISEIADAVHILWPILESTPFWNCASAFWTSITW